MSPVNNDLAWQAFRYVADEMTADEIAAFEELLANDQRAREEVASAVELAQAVATVPEAVCLRPQSPGWSHRLAWMAVGTAACLAMVAALELMKRAEEPLAQWPNEAGHSLAAAWVGSQQVGEESDNSPAEFSEPAASDETNEADDMAVPGWLLAAVSGSPPAVTVPGSVGPGNNAGLEN